MREAGNPPRTGRFAGCVKETVTAQRRVSHHLLLCATPTSGKCCDPEAGNASWNELKQVIRELDLENPGRPQGIVLRSKADCLRVCERGPILLIWPDGIWYAEATADRIRTIVEEHIVHKRPVHDWIFQTTPLQREP